jgi:Rrf2 family iron-sulfur cluster assembly transcriptional regulator
MKITKEADYALRIVAMLAKSGKQIEAKVIAERNHIPYRFTLKILRKIVQAGYLKSFRGVGGGYALNKKPSEITLRHIIEVIDGDISLSGCLSGKDDCLHSDCMIKRSLAHVQQVITDELDSVTFEDIIS